jgi:hypothetical protein
VQALFEDLFARLLIARPAAPLDFLSSAALEFGGAPKGSVYFTDADLRGVHRMYDPSANNYISGAQARAAMRACGVPAAAAEEWVAGGEDPDRVTAEAFVEGARGLLA